MTQRHEGDVGMVTGKVAMGMVVFKEMKEGLFIRTVGRLKVGCSLYKL